MTNFVNLTPHPIVLRFESGEDLTIPPRSAADGGPARVSSTPGELVAHANGVPIYGPPTWGLVVGLSAPSADTILIVSALVLGRPEVAGRVDVVGPGTGPADGAIRVADGPQKGQILAVTRLIRA